SGGRAVEHDSDEHQRAASYSLRRQQGPHAPDGPGLEQAFGVSPAGSGAEADFAGKVGVGYPPVPLQRAEDTAIEGGEVSLGFSRRHTKILRRLTSITKYTP